MIVRRHSGESVLRVLLRAIAAVVGLHMALAALDARAEASGVPTAGSGTDLHRYGRQGTAASLLWEPITRQSEYWVLGKGDPPELGWGGVSELRLERGREAAILLPAWGWLRIEARSAATAAPRVSLSGGSGVDVEALLIPSSDGRAWLLRTDLPQPVVALLRLPPDAVQPFHYGLFVPRRQPAPASLVTGSFIELPGVEVPVRQADQPVSEPFFRLRFGSSTEVEVQGPARLELQARIEGGPDLSGAVLVLDAATGMKDTRLTLRRLPSGNELRAPVEVNGEWLPVGRLERFAVDIPEGTHRLRLGFSHSVLARLVALEGPQLLLDLNTPAAWSESVLDPLTERWLQEAMAAATSNRWRDTGTAVAQRMQQLGGQRPEQPTLAALANEFEGVVGQWHALPPADAALASATSPAVLAASTLSRTPIDPLQRKRVGVTSVDAPIAALPQDLFHRVGAEPRSFALPPSTGLPRRMRLRVLEPGRTPALLEVRVGGGRTWEVRTGTIMLEPHQLAPDSTAIPALLPGSSENGLSSPSAAPLMESGDAQWWLPEDASLLSVRALEGEALIGLEWRGSGDVGLDDGAAASLVRQRFTSGEPSLVPPLRALAEDAWRPVERLARASLAQLSSGVQPLGPASTVDAATAQRSAIQARQERDPALALSHWALAMRGPDPTLRSEALRGQVNALLANGERFVAEQALRAAWLGTDAALATTAFDELQAMSARENDQEAQLLLAASAVAREPGRAGALAARLSASGEDRLALTAALAAPQLSVEDRRSLLPALLASALRARMPATFEALLASPAIDVDEVTFWRGLRALHVGQFEQAITHLRQARKAEWVRHVERAIEIKAALAHARSPAAVQDWLAWQAAHPGPRHWSAEPDALYAHRGGLVARSVARNLRSAWWQATEQQPMVLQVIGPARLRVEARPLHAGPEALLEGWLRVEGEGQLWIQPYERNRISPGLEIDAEGVGFRLGESIERVIDIAPGVHRLQVHAGAQAVAARYEIERPSLLAPSLLPLPSVTHFKAQAVRVASAVPAPTCGASTGCLLTLPGPLAAASHRVLEPVDWPGLPVPLRGQDFAAARLASRDVLGAVQAAREPAEKLRLLAWLAETKPVERARAVAMGAQLRGINSDPQLLAAWQRLSRDTQWVLQPLVTRSAGLRSVPVSYGTPQSPAARLRASLLAPLGPDEVRLSGETGAVFSVVDPKPTSTLIHLVAEDLPGFPPLPITAEVQVDGRTLRQIGLPSPGSRQSVPVVLPPGDHAIAVRLVESFANQTVRVRFDSGGPALPELRRDWQIATGAQPVRVTVAGPAWLRVDRLDARGEVQSEERFVKKEGVQTLDLTTGPGARETLYRVFLRRLTSVATGVRPPRPNLYAPEPVPNPPVEWAAAPAAPPVKAVQFEDAVSMDRLLDYTWTPVLALHQRLDPEATGGSAQPRQERFAEAGATWARRSGNGESWRGADAFVRVPQRGLPVLGLRVAATEAVGWLPGLPLPLELSTSAAGFAQNTPAGLGTRVHLQASVAQTRRLGPQLIHRPQMGAFVQYSSLRDVDAVRLDRVDTDLYSSYRQQHRFGLTLSDTVAWQPWRDTEVALFGRVLSNENLTPDNLRLEWTAQLLAGAWRVGFGVRHTRYLSDRHRAASVGVTEPMLSIGGEHWMSDGRRMEVRLAVRRDSLTGTVTAGVDLLWHQSAGRRLWDMGPGDRDFRELREWRRAPPVNSVEAVR